MENNKEFKKYLKRLDKRKKNGILYYVDNAELLTKEEAYNSWKNQKTLT